MMPTTPKPKNSNWRCSVCGGPAQTARNEPDGTYTPFCQQHIPDEDARALDEQQRGKAALEQVPCTRCGGVMRLTQRKISAPLAGGPSYEAQSFECTACGKLMSRTVKHTI